MGIFDTIKSLLGGVSGAETKDVSPTTHAPETRSASRAEQAVEIEPSGDNFAGFDPDDEDSFFEAVRHMDTAGAMGGTDESRARIMQEHGLRDHLHWQSVRDSVMRGLMQKYGSIEEVGQRQLNWLSNQLQKDMQAKTANMAASGEMEPVEGVSLEAWAAFNAAIVQGTSFEDLLRGAGINQARWDRASAEWNARMARDTTFAISTAYGNAFQNASKGQYAAYAKEAMAARSENRDLAMEPPVTLEKFYRIMYEQSYADRQGLTAAQALKNMGLSIVDWTDLGAFMGYYIMRTGVRDFEEQTAISEKVRLEYEAKFPGVKADLDISF